MGATNWIVLLLTHPFEFRTLLQFYLYHEQKRDIAALQEHPTSGWDRASMRRCWEFLDQTSRSFSAVIKELDGDLARTVGVPVWLGAPPVASNLICMFYLVLRGLDTIEDDMTIPDEIKQPILRSFHIHTVTPGWNFNGCGPKEKDRQLLIEYDTIVEEVNRLAPESVFLCSPRFGHMLKHVVPVQTGMADYAHKAATTGSIYLETVAEYDLYCHYVAGLVGEGLSRIFSASNKEASWLGDQLELSNSMGLLLQKTNIIRDYREDVDQHRYFWPREIWGRKEYGFTEMKEMYEPIAHQRAQWAQSGMVVDALRHATDSLDYLRVLKNQSVFNFCAIPASMAMATLELCFMNPAMFQRNIKIRKAEAAQLIMRSTNPREVAYMFRDYARKIHAKALPSDPNFLRISVACGKIEQWCEHNYPSFIRMSTNAEGGVKQELDPYDPRTRIVHMEQTLEEALTRKKRAEEIRNGIHPTEVKAAQNEVTVPELMMYVLGGMAVLVVMSAGIIYLVLKFSD
ncbi:squalene synthase [Infundibulicybe gibba]|nr:squalene synthase [Infundibulicybe gibba]